MMTVKHVFYGTLTLPNKIPCFIILTHSNQQWINLVQWKFAKQISWNSNDMKIESMKLPTASTNTALLFRMKVKNDSARWVHSGIVAFQWYFNWMHWKAIKNTWKLEIRNKKQVLIFERPLWKFTAKRTVH